MTQKQRYKPLYKKFNRLFENVQSRQKIFNFKKHKWTALINRLKKGNYFRKKNKVLNYNGNTIVPLVEYRKPPKFKKRYRYLMHAAKKINLYYGGLKEKYMRKFVKNIWRHKKKKSKNKILARTEFNFLDIMESRLESVLHRSFFTQSIKNARQLILHGHVFVNGQIIKHGSYILKENDIVEINSKFHEFIRFNIKKSKFGHIQQNSLITNYKTLQILYLNRSKLDTFANLFSFRINIKNVIRYYRYN
uniref:Ribosomal protein S4 n=1 Tax=Eunotia naegelii TaxID=1458866 RepID=A0A2U9GIU1_9STRA|nr:ribosomal protein S4 [Eunotia naegelii]AWQ64095.1 ribosomal protein S4 [Eunotia naegelii]